ncbi:MAG: DUF4258 domain-containing protein [Alphaproteobacteria bacterium]|nr:DUF4258 domain-containing protein [Alphaproteobacteria bacterium]
MDAASFTRKVREYATDSGNVFVVAHARRRMAERGITLPQILEALRKGIVVEGPTLNAHRNWQATIRRFAAGEEIEVVAALDRGVIVITVY